MLPFRRGAAWQTFFLLCAILFINEVRSEGRVVCYYTNWSVYRPGTAKFNPQNINPYLCTHLVYAFGGFTKDNQMKPFDKYQDIEQGGYAKFTGLKTYNKQLKTMIAIGGWNEASSRFSPLVASPERRQQFIKNILKFLRQNHFDGIDLDWEYPAHREGGKPRDRDNYAQFVQELRAEFERESEKTGRPRLLLTMAVPAGIEYIDKGYDVPKLNKYLDWFNVLTYDFHSSHEPSANHHAPLYSLEEESEYNYDAELNIDYSIKYYLKAGADRDKLVLGIPTYGRSYTLINEESTELGAPSEGPGEQGDATREKGYLAYYEICQNLKEDPEWTVVQPNENAMGPYAYRRNQWVGYDDEAIVRKKAEYVVAHGLGGIMFWAIDNDDFRGTCSGKPYPLIEAAKEAMLEALGVGINEVAKPRAPQKPPRSRSRENSASTRNRIGITAEDKTTQRKESGRRPLSGGNSGARKPSTTLPPSTTIKLTEAEGSSLYIGGRTTTPPPPTTPDPGSDFKCEEEGFFQHPRDCKKYYWCLDSGPSGLGIVAHQFTCPSGLYFNPAADSCDFARNVPCKTKKSTTASPPVTAAYTTTTTVRPTFASNRITAATSRTSFLRTSTTSTTTTTTTPAPPAEEDDAEYEDEDGVRNTGFKSTDAEEDPKVIKELIELIRKVGGVEELEKHLLRKEDGSISIKENAAVGVSTTPSSISKSLYDKVLSRPGTLNSFRNRFTSSSTFRKNEKTKSNSDSVETSETSEDNTNTGSKTVAGNSFSSYSKYSSVLRGNSRQGPQNEGLEKLAEFDGFLKEKKQYVTINRNRGSASPNAGDIDDEEANTREDDAEEEEEEEEAQAPRVVTTKRPPSAATPSYTSLRRTRPTTSAPTVEQADIAVSQEQEADNKSAKDERKQYTTLSRNRLRASTTTTTTEKQENETPTTSFTNRYKYFERTRPTKSSIANADSADAEDNDNEDEEIEEHGVEDEQQNVTVHLSAANATKQTSQVTNTRLQYASIGRRTTTTTATPETSTTTTVNNNSTETTTTTTTTTSTETSNNQDTKTTTNETSESISTATPTSTSTATVTATATITTTNPTIITTTENAFTTTNLPPTTSTFLNEIDGDDNEQLLSTVMTIDPVVEYKSENDISDIAQNLSNDVNSQVQASQASPESNNATIQATTELATSTVVVDETTPTAPTTPTTAKTTTKTLTTTGTTDIATELNDSEVTNSKIQANKTQYKYTTRTQGIASNGNKISATVYKKNSNDNSISTDDTEDTDSHVDDGVESSSLKHINNGLSSDRLRLNNIKYASSSGGRSQQQQQLLNRRTETAQTVNTSTATSAAATTTTTATNDDELNSPTNAFPGTVSSPRPFGFPRRRTRPTASTSHSTSTASSLNTIQTVTTDDNLRPQSDVNVNLVKTKFKSQVDTNKVSPSSSLELLNDQKTTTTTTKKSTATTTTATSKIREHNTVDINVVDVVELSGKGGNSLRHGENSLSSERKSDTDISDEDTGKPLSKYSWRDERRPTKTPPKQSKAKTDDGSYREKNLPYIHNTLVGGDDKAEYLSRQTVDHSDTGKYRGKSLAHQSEETTVTENELTTNKFRSRGLKTIISENLNGSETEQSEEHDTQKAGKYQTINKANTADLSIVNGLAASSNKTENKLNTSTVSSNSIDKIINKSETDGQANIEQTILETSSEHAQAGVETETSAEKDGALRSSENKENSGEAASVRSVEHKELQNNESNSSEHATAGVETETSAEKAGTQINSENKENSGEAASVSSVEHKELQNNESNSSEHATAGVETETSAEKAGTQISSENKENSGEAASVSSVEHKELQNNESNSSEHATAGVKTEKSAEKAGTQISSENKENYGEAASVSSVKHKELQNNESNSSEHATAGVETEKSAEKAGTQISSENKENSGEASVSSVEHKELQNNESNSSEHATAGVETEKSAEKAGTHISSENKENSGEAASVSSVEHKELQNNESNSSEHATSGIKTENKTVNRLRTSASKATTEKAATQINSLLKKNSSEAVLDSSAEHKELQSKESSSSEQGIVVVKAENKTVNYHSINRFRTSASEAAAEKAEAQISSQARENSGEAASDNSAEQEIQNKESTRSEHASAGIRTKGISNESGTSRNKQSRYQTIRRDQQYVKDSTTDENFEISQKKSSTKNSETNSSLTYDGASKYKTIARTANRNDASDENLHYNAIVRDNAGAHLTEDSTSSFIKNLSDAERTRTYQAVSRGGQIVTESKEREAEGHILGKMQGASLIKEGSDQRIVQSTTTKRSELLADENVAAEVLDEENTSASKTQNLNVDVDTAAEQESVETSTTDLKSEEATESTTLSSFGGSESNIAGVSSNGVAVSNVSVSSSETTKDISTEETNVPITTETSATDIPLENSTEHNGSSTDKSLSTAEVTSQDKTTESTSSTAAAASTEFSSVSSLFKYRSTTERITVLSEEELSTTSTTTEPPLFRVKSTTATPVETSNEASTTRRPIIRNRYSAKTEDNSDAVLTQKSTTTSEENSSVSETEHNNKSSTRHSHFRNRSTATTEESTSAASSEELSTEATTRRSFFKYKISTTTGTTSTEAEQESTSEATTRRSVFKSRLDTNKFTDSTKESTIDLENNNELSSVRNKVGKKFVRRRPVKQTESDLSSDIVKDIFEKNISNENEKNSTQSTLRRRVIVRGTYRPRKEGDLSSLLAVDANKQHRGGQYNHTAATESFNKLAQKTATSGAAQSGETHKFVKKTLQSSQHDTSEINSNTSNAQNSESEHRDEASVSHSNKESITTNATHSDEVNTSEKNISLNKNSVVASQLGATEPLKTTDRSEESGQAEFEVSIENSSHGSSLGNAYSQNQVRSKLTSQSGQATARSRGVSSQFAYKQTAKATQGSSLTTDSAVENTQTAAEVNSKKSSDVSSVGNSDSQSQVRSKIASQSKLTNAARNRTTSRTEALGDGITRTRTTSVRTFNAGSNKQKVVKRIHTKIIEEKPEEFEVVYDVVTEEIPTTTRRPITRNRGSARFQSNDLSSLLSLDVPLKSKRKQNVEQRVIKTRRRLIKKPKETHEHEEVEEYEYEYENENQSAERATRPPRPQTTEATFVSTRRRTMPTRPIRTTTARSTSSSTEKIEESTTVRPRISATKRVFTIKRPVSTGTTTTPAPISEFNEVERKSNSNTAKQTRVEEPTTVRPRKRVLAVRRPVSSTTAAPSLKLNEVDLKPNGNVEEQNTVSNNIHQSEKRVNLTNRVRKPLNITQNSQASEEKNVLNSEHKESENSTFTINRFDETTNKNKTIHVSEAGDSINTNRRQSVEHGSFSKTDITNSEGLNGTKNTKVEQDSEETQAKGTLSNHSLQQSVSEIQNSNESHINNSVTQTIVNNSKTGTSTTTIQTSSTLATTEANDNLDLLKLKFSKAFNQLKATADTDANSIEVNIGETDETRNSKAGLKQALNGSGEDNLSLPIYHRRKYFPYYKDSPITYIDTTIGASSLSQDTSTANIKKQIHEVFNVSDNEQTVNSVENFAENERHLATEQAKEINAELSHFLLKTPGSK